MENLIENILTEWAYRVNDGTPNPKNPLHIVQLEKSLNELKLPKPVIIKVLEKIRKYADTPQNRKLDRVGKSWGSEGDDKEKDDEDLINRDGFDKKDKKNKDAPNGPTQQ